MVHGADLAAADLDELIAHVKARLLGKTAGDVLMLEDESGRIALRLPAQLSDQEGVLLTGVVAGIAGTLNQCVHALRWAHYGDTLQSK